MDYDPTGPDGKGEMDVTIDGQSANFTGFNNGDLNPFTHFGIMPVSADGSASRIWIDDLTFTAVPEPATMLLMACGGLTVAAGRRRRM